MNLNRRDFLKGLAALAGVAAVGVPGATEATELPPVVTVDNGPLGHGRDGFLVQIDGTWYALHDASVSMTANPRMIEPDGIWLQYAAGPREWTMELALEPMDQLGSLLIAGRKVSICLGVPHASYRGEGWLTGISTEIDVSGRAIQRVDLYGNGPLSCERI